MVKQVCTECKRALPPIEFEPGRKTCYACKHDRFHHWYWKNWADHNDKTRIKNMTGRHSFGKSLAGPIEWLNR